MPNEYPERTSPLGTPMSKIVDTLVSGATTPTASSPTFEPGRQTSRLPARLTSVTQGSSGKHGAVTRPISAGELPALMARGDPEETDKALEVSLRQLIASFPNSRMRASYHPEHGYDSEFDGYDELTGPIDPMALASGQQLVRTALRPAPMSEVAKELGRVRIGTAGRAAGAEDMEAWLIVFGDELSQFPLDVVRECCRKWVRREKWQPTVAEIRDDCLRRVARRQAMLRTLQPRF